MTRVRQHVSIVHTDARRRLVDEANWPARRQAHPQLPIRRSREIAVLGKTAKTTPPFLDCGGDFKLD